MFKLTANLVAALASGFNGTGRLLPLGVGLKSVLFHSHFNNPLTSDITPSVNFPLFTPGGNCTAVSVLLASAGLSSNLLLVPASVYLHSHNWSRDDRQALY